MAGRTLSWWRPTRACSASGSCDQQQRVLLKACPPREEAGDGERGGGGQRSGTGRKPVCTAYPAGKMHLSTSNKLHGLWQPDAKSYPGRKPAPCSPPFKQSSPGEMQPSLRRPRSPAGTHEFPCAAAVASRASRPPYGCAALPPLLWDRLHQGCLRPAQLPPPLALAAPRAAAFAACASLQRGL